MVPGPRASRAVTIEMEGAPDLVVEIVNGSPVGEDARWRDRASAVLGREVRPVREGVREGIALFPLDLGAGPAR